MFSDILFRFFLLLLHPSSDIALWRHYTKAKTTVFFIADKAKNYN